MKLSEIKKIIEEGYFSDEIFADFQTALKRVPKRLRCQHCYTSAWYLKDKYLQDAIRLIQFGLENYESDWVDKMRAYQNLGGIYESCEEYEAAKTAFENALAAIPDDKKRHYTSISMHILRMELHCNNFSYTDYLYELYQDIITADSFSASFREFVFYRSIAEMIIAKKDGNQAKQKDAYLAAILALDANRLTGMDLLLNRHKYKDDACATKQAIEFLRKNRL